MDVVYLSSFIGKSSQVIIHGVVKKLQGKKDPGM
jgi:hypothetical protein